MGMEKSPAFCYEKLLYINLDPNSAGVSGTQNGVLTLPKTNIAPENRPPQ